MADLEKKASHTSHASFSKDDGVDRHLQVQMPTSLVGLDVHQLDSIDKKITWKIDLLLLPGLIVLYILNFLDRQSEFFRERGDVENVVATEHHCLDQWDTADSRHFVRQDWRHDRGPRPDYDRVQRLRLYSFCWLQ